MKKIFITLLIFNLLILIINYTFAQNNLLDIEWEKTFGENSDDNVNIIIQTINGNYIILGVTKTEIPKSTIIKVNKNGEVLWEKTYENIELQDIKQTTDEGFITVGYSYPKNYHHSWEIKGESHIIKLNKNGDKEWEEIFTKGSNYANSIIQTKDEGYFIIFG